MDWATGAGWAIHAAMGIGLAASAGLRAFLPLFVVGIAGRLGWVSLSPGFDWLAEVPALVVFGAAVAIELVADKVPVVDHVLDVAHGLIKPAAGGLVMATVVADLTPLYATLLLVAAGGTTAGAVHLTKAQARVASTATTAGIGNPVLSAAEDAISLAGSVASIAIPIAAALLVLAFLALAVIALVLLRRRIAPSRTG
jgi:hypothetical protein